MAKLTAQLVAAVFASLFTLVSLQGSLALAENYLDKFPPEARVWAPYLRELHAVKFKCPKSGLETQNHNHCIFPSYFSITFSPNRAEFTLKGLAYLPGAVALPNLTQSFTLNGQSGVLTKSGVKVDGPFTITGAFKYSQLPNRIDIPNSYGLVEVNFSEDLGSYSYDLTDSDIRLVNNQQTVRINNSLESQIVRHVRDDHPYGFDTYLILRVTGEVRVHKFKNIMIPEVAPLRITSPLESYLEDKDLKVELRPGTHVLKIEGVTPSLSTFKLPGQILCWQPYRNTRIDGVYPLLTDIPSELPPLGCDFYRVEEGVTFTIEEESKPMGYDLALQRTIYATEDRLIFADQISGHHSSLSRLEPRDFTLARAQVNGESWFITEDENQAGIEIREDNVNLTSVGYRPHGEISLGGWNEKFNQVNLELVLPRGAELFHVSGFAGSSGSWLDSWNLLKLFGILTISIFCYRLFGILAGIIFALGAVLAHGEILYPSYTFLYLLVAAAIRRLVSNSEIGTQNGGGLGKFDKYFYLILALWVFQCVTYAKVNFAKFLYPQVSFVTSVFQGLITSLDSFYGVFFLLGLLFIFAVTAWIFDFAKKIASKFWSILFFLGAGGVALIVCILMIVSFINVSQPPVYFNPPAVETQQGNYAQSQPKRALSPSSLSRNKLDQALMSLESDSYMAEETRLEKAQQKKEDLFGSNAPQAGLTLPDYRATRSYYLSANNVSDEKIDFIFLSLSQMRFVAGARLLLVLLLIFFVARRLFGNISWKPAATLVIVGIIAGNSSAQAQGISSNAIDKQELLRLIESHELCATDCSSINKLKITEIDNRLLFDFTVATDKLATVLLPANLRLVSVDESDNFQALRNGTNIEVVARDKIKAYLEVKDKLEVRFIQRPLHTTFAGQTLRAEGINQGDIIRFFRAKSTLGDKKPDESEHPQDAYLKNWYYVTRQINIGDQVSVETLVRRFAHYKQESIKIPLLEGERLLDAREQDGFAQVSFAQGVREQRYRSLLSSIELSKQGDLPIDITETWQVTCAPYVKCDYMGLKPVKISLDGKRAFIWQPEDGAKATVSFRYLKGIPGDPVTIDAINNSITRDVRGDYYGEIQGSVRAVVAGSEVRAELPQGVKFISASGLEPTLKDDTLIWLVPKGISQIIFKYQAPGLARFEFSRPTYNERLTYQPNGEFIYHIANGSFAGPAVLMWIKMFIFVAIAAGLAYYRLLPLTVMQSVILSLGLTILPVYGFSVVIMLLLGARFFKQLIEFFKPSKLTLYTCIAVALPVLAWILFYLLRAHLIMPPHSLIAGTGSHEFYLKWFVYEASANVALPTLYTVPAYVSRGLSLIWCCWLALLVFRKAPGVVRGVME